MVPLHKIKLNYEKRGAAVLLKTSEDGALKNDQHHNIAEDGPKSHGQVAGKKTRRHDCEQS